MFTSSRSLFSPLYRALHLHLENTLNGTQWGKESVGISVLSIFFLFLPHKRVGDFPGGPVVKNLPTIQGTRVQSPGLGRFHSHVEQPSLGAPAKSMEPGSLNYQARVRQLLKPLHPTARALQQENLLR